METGGVKGGVDGCLSVRACVSMQAFVEDVNAASDGWPSGVYVSVHERECASRLEKHGLMDGWRSRGRVRGSKGFDSEDERQRVCFDLVMKGLRVAVETG